MKLRLRLEEITPITDRIKAYRFAGVGGKLPPFSPGSSLRIQLPVRSGLANAYSLMADPADPEFYTIAVRKEDPERSKGGSIFLHESARTGDEFDAFLPENHFPPLRTARKHLLIAAGIGVTPFLSYLPELNRWAAAVEMHYVYRGGSGAAFVERLLRQLGDRLTLHDSASTGRCSVLEILSVQPVGTHVYVCGPHALIREVRDLAAELGWPPACVHFEQFSPGEVPPGRPFDVHLARSGRDISVRADETLLEGLERNGIDAPYSCRVGGCGTCRVGVIRGAIEHRDDCLTEEERTEGRSIITCVSRAGNGALVLDL